MTGEGRPVHRLGRSGWGVALLGVVALAAGCAPPDRPAALAEPLPEAALELLRPDTTRTIRVADGVFYRYLWSDRGPWAVHLLEVDRRRCDLGFTAVRAPSDPGMAGGRDPVTELVERAPRSAVAAVNGDFFTPEGRPVGPEATPAGIRSPGARPAFAWDPRRGPWIGTTTVVSGRLRAGGSVDPGRTAVVGGFPELLDRGGRVGDLEVSARASFAAARHPRTAVGFDDHGTLWLAVVDGRQGAYSQGMSLPELTELFEALGVEEAVNLDGGGSSVLVVGGAAVSRPSDETGERPVVNALVLVQDDAYCRIRRSGGGTERLTR